MRFNRWVLKPALNDIERLCANHLQWEPAIRILADWIVVELGEDAHQKGEWLEFPDDSKKSYRRWAVGPLVVVFTLLPLDDRTVIIEGFAPSP